MRLYLLSDLHRDFAPFTPPPVEADVVVLAGDIDRGVRGLEWARGRFPDVVAAPPVQLWVHGHTHYAVDYRLGDSRVVSNPRGYADEPTRFREDLIVEIQA